MHDSRPDLDEAARGIALRRLQNAYADVVTRRAWSELDDLAHDLRLGAG